MSKIQWTTTTWNPIAGCTRVAPECANCYAIPMAARLDAMGQGKYQGLVTPVTKNWTGKINFDPASLTKPAGWKKPRMVFVNSMSDLFHEGVSDRMIAEIIAAMLAAPQHRYQVLTKRPDRMAAVMGQFCPKKMGHIWFGTSAGCPRTLAKSHSGMATLAALGFKVWVSCEPQLAAVDWDGWDFLSWIVVGGESGHGARPFQGEWALSSIAWATAHGVPIFVKQMGRINSLDGQVIDPSPKGDDFESWPTALQVRQYPEGMTL